VYRELHFRGMSERIAREVTANPRCWWKNTGMYLQEFHGVGILLGVGPALAYAPGRGHSPDSQTQSHDPAQARLGTRIVSLFDGRVVQDERLR